MQNKDKIFGLTKEAHKQEPNKEQQNPSLVF
jgi:hypothetical protein